jgi:hypothetical protein
MMNASHNPSPTLRTPAVNRSTSPFALLTALLSTLLVACGSLQASLAAEVPLESGWVSLFDGKSLDSWTASENKASCRVEDGLLLIGGERSHLFYNGPVDDHDFTDFELKLEVKTTPGSNSGVFFHTEYQEEGWPTKGHEAQVNSTHKDWRRTASLYAVKDIRDAVSKDDQWFEYHIIVRGNQITMKVDGKTVNEFTEDPDAPNLAERPDRKLSSGTIALQAHDPGSLVYYRNIRIKTPATTAAAAKPAAKQGKTKRRSKSRRMLRKRAARRCRCR